MRRVRPIEPPPESRESQVREPRIREPEEPVFGEDEDRHPTRDRQRPELRVIDEEPPVKRPAEKRKKSGSKKVESHRRRGWRSPLTWRILTINVSVLLIPVLGLLHLDQYRQSLIESELESMRIQARAFSLSLGSAAVAISEAGTEELQSDIIRRIMRVLLADTRVRARLFGDNGDLLVDSFLLSGPGGQVQVLELPPSYSGRFAEINRLYDAIVTWLPGQGELPLYKENLEQVASDYSEVITALAGGTDGKVRADAQGNLILSVAVPVQRYRQVLGALMLSKGGGDIKAAVQNRRRDILLVFGLTFGVTVLLALYLAGTIARPIRRLARAADQVRSGSGRQFQIPDMRHRGDEVGDLAGALHDMTEALWERLDAIEGFAADVAHEIKNPLTSLRSAVETVARVEDPDQQKRLMSIILDDVQRLDRLISDISDASRLDAELSRAQTDLVDMATLLRALVDVHRASSFAEDDDHDGPRFKLDIGYHQSLMVQGMEGRLGQVFRNLISNAMTFSPKGGTIRLSAHRIGDIVQVSVEDQGPGIPEGKLDAIFNRFYTERPKTEKFGTHSGLGLSISKQIVDAHGGTIRAENLTDDRGEILGARFVIRLPAD
ncbi:MAG: stimulus-sensing domain-containing protein [Pseudomonadota bacterium]